MLQTAPAPGFLKFLRRLDQEFPGQTPLHLVMDNDGTHKHPKVQPAERTSALRTCADKFQLVESGGQVRRTHFLTSPPWIL